MVDKEKLSVGKVMLDKLNEILGYSKNNERKLIVLNNQNRELYQMLQGMYKMNIKSQIPYMTPKQLVSLMHRGWTVEELSALSGYSVEEVKKKITGYKNV